MLSSCRGGGAAPAQKAVQLPVFDQRLLQKLQERGRVLEDIPGGDPGHRRHGGFHQVVLDLLHQLLDVGIVGVKGGAVDVGPGHDVGNGDLFVILFLQKL